jgi:hypothetical protein
MPSLFMLAALASIGGWPATFPSVRIALAVDTAVPPEIARGAVDEASAIWAPYGVAIRPIEPVEPDSFKHPRRVTLAIRVAGAPPDPARAWASPFASIRFLPDGEPEATIVLHYDAVLRLGLGTISIAGARERQWPRDLRNQLLGRIVGRVVAHEVGHWLLRSPSHSATGLMRAQHTTDALADPGRGGFVLLRSDVARLRAALTPRVDGPM